MFSRTARRRIKQLLLWAEIVFILVMGAGVGVVAGAFYQMSKLLPPDSAIARYQPVAGTKLYSSDGVLLGSIAEENRDPVEIKKIPKRLQDAIVAIEDSRFYEHSGIDFHGLARALWQNVYFGSKAYGVQAAARTYFDKNVWQLNLAQCALIAGLPQRPSKLNPYEYPA